MWTLREAHWPGAARDRGCRSRVEPLSLSAAEVAAVTGGRVIHGDPALPIGRISIDSRTIEPGDFFVAITGERFDAHEFVPEVLARGAAGALVHREASISGIETARATPVVIQVQDTTRALQEVAHDVRRRSGTKVVAITGSAGKTTTKEVAADLLSTSHSVFRNRGNLNNHIGLPLSLLELRSRPEIAVVELGMNHPGEIRTLVGIAEPDVRVWTNVGDAHLGFFASPDAIADAKAEILEQARPEDVLVANANDARVMRRAEWFLGRVVTFGIDTAADVAASEVEHRGLDGVAARLRTAGAEVVLRTPLLGLGNLSNILAATAVALEFDVPVSEIVESAARLRPAAHRGELLRLPGGVTLIDDSYNSSPAALRQALDTLAAAQGCARRVAVLGEMLELGEHSARLHEASGRAAAAAGLDRLIAVGGTAAGVLAEAAIAGGMPAEHVAHVANRDEAAALALKRVRPGDLVLVKGSRGIGTDLVVERLKAEFA
jgi:UDP-N-acetylmuramoyl-tripeptide--D-alanyl-D-alanine ligase